MNTVAIAFPSDFAAYLSKERHAAMNSVFV